jgi:hypothetical protein
MNTERLFKLHQFVLIKEDDKSELELQVGQIVKIVEEDFYTIPEEQIYTVRFMYHGYNKNDNDTYQDVSAINLIPYYPYDADFSFIKDDETKAIISSAYNCVMKLDRWKSIREFTGTSFIFCKDKDINKIMYDINDNYEGHSGSSLGFVMRQLEQISKIGYHKFRDEWIE